MPSTQTSRLDGLSTSVAVKAPCRVATTANLAALSGLLTIDGVTVAADDRVLVKDQTTTTENGIYKAASAAWTRADDFNGSYDVVGGTQVSVTSGTANAGTYWRVSGNGALSPGTDAITFVAGIGSAVSGLSFTDTGTGATEINLQTMLRSEWINVKAFGAVGDGTTTDTTAIQNAANAAIAQGRALFFPPGTYKTGAITFAPTDNVSYAPGFRACIVIIGCGPSATIFDMVGTNAATLDLSTGTANKFMFGVDISGFTIRTSTNAAGSGGIKITSTIMAKLSNIHIIGMQDYGLKLVCDAGDADGPAGFTLENIWINDCLGWGIDAAAEDGHNELSLLKLDNVRCSACGTSNDKTITAITAAAPPVVTSTAHGLAENSKRVLYDVVGMTQVNGRRFLIEETASADTFRLNDFSDVAIAGTSYTAYSSGGVAAHYSGGMVWKGQILHVINSAFVLNENVGLLIPGESGLGNTVIIDSTAFENNIGRHCVVSGLDGFAARGVQLYSNNTSLAKYGFYFNASYLAVNEILIDGVVLRAMSLNNPYTAFHYEPATANSPLSRGRVRGIRAQNFFHPGQIMFSGFFFEPIAEQARLTTTAALASYGPDFTTGGRMVPWRQAYGGESSTSSTAGSTSGHGDTGPWIAVPLNSAVTFSSTTLTTGVTYASYLYDFGNTYLAEASTVVPTMDTASGYQVMTGHARKRYIGRVSVGSTGGFLTSESGDANWLNPTWMAGGWYWTDTSGRAIVKASTSGAFTTLPTGDTDGEVLAAQSTA